MSIVRHIPNALTIARILLVPVFIYLLVADRYYAAGIVFVIAGIFDSLDGYIAKKFNAQSEFGARLDPVADKLLVTIGYIILTAKGIIPLWLGVPAVARDFMIISIVCVAAIRRGSIRSVTLPGVLGKAATVLQVITAGYALIALEALGPTGFYLFAAVTAVLTVYSGIEYAVKEIKKLRRAA